MRRAFGSSTCAPNVIVPKQTFETSTSVVANPIDFIAFPCHMPCGPSIPNGSAAWQRLSGLP